jgi:hypothetical protein
MKRVGVLAAMLLIASACAKKDDRGAAEKQFRETLSGATLVGHFTVGERAGLSEEKYAIQKVSKLAGDTWIFEARVQYGSHDFTLPFPLTVKWAGDTPVISVTDLTVPGVGTYTARVLVYRGQYAGTWSGKNHGGQLFGKIVK